MFLHIFGNNMSVKHNQPKLWSLPLPCCKKSKIQFKNTFSSFNVDNWHQINYGNVRQKQKSI